jgi:hypothetical protein
MPSAFNETSSQKTSDPYPEVDEATRSRIAEKLADIVALLHPEGLSEGQLREVAASLAIQTGNTERLHRFVLSNAMEPAFSIQLYAGMNDDG